jgi:hypothetical protein
VTEARALAPVDLARLAPARVVQTLREQIAPGATDQELLYFAQVCARLNLSPFADQIALVGRWDSRVGATVHRHQITVAGRRTLAARTGRLVRTDGPVWCGPRVRGELEWRDVWDDDEVPYCARVLVYTVASGEHPAANGTAKWSEFVVRNRDGSVSPLWARMPSHMLGKCAESLALRRAFPDTITADIVGGFVGYEDDGAEVADDDVVAESVPPAATIPVPPAGGTVPVGDQSAAHRAVAQLDAEARQAWLDAHGIEDFGSVWDAEAVTDALEGPFQ